MESAIKPENENNEKDNSCDRESVQSEEIEPKLKYMRMTNDLVNILKKDAASCIAVHPKFICIGTQFGWIYMLDHQGNSVRYKDNASQGFNAHTVSVNMISVDVNGDFIASCSDDGKVLVHGFYTSEHNQTLMLGRLVKCVAIDPNYSKPGTGRRFVTGDERLVLHEKTFLSRIRSTVLFDMGVEGGVQNVRWSEAGQHIAWATQQGVRVYDITNKCSLGLVKWTKSTNFEGEKSRCNLCWKDATTLLVGWVDTVRILNVRRRTHTEMALTPDWPQFVVEIVLSFQTDFLICGVGPLDSQLVVLGYWRADDGAQRPQLHVLEPRPGDYGSVCTDNLSLRGYTEYTCNDYFLECLVEENCYLVMCPKDVVVATPVDADDRISWLMDHWKFEEAMVAVESNEKEVQRYTKLSIGQAYLDHLLLLEEYEKAAQLCQNILGTNKRLWEEEVFKFARVHQLRTVSPYLPIHSNCLDPYIYEMVLYEFLKMDPQGFLEKIKEWPPTLYKLPAVVNATLEHLLVVNQSDFKSTLLEALALLYSYDKKYDKSLQMYLKLKHRGVFELIAKHSLYSVIHSMIEDLMELDADQTVALLLDHVTPDVVVKRLQHNKQRLYQYLDALDQRKDIRSAGRKYHGLLVSLYADFAREKLLALLRRSDHYPIQEALTICKDRCFYPEMVYLLGRIGNTKEALELITQQLGDIEQAISFCKEHDDPDLWEDLINCSLKRPDFITFLLQRIGTYIDPRLLVQRIDNSLAIPGLKNSLVKLMQDYNLQVSVQEGCKKILVSDYFNLHERLVSMQQRGVLIDDDYFCGACHRKIIVKDTSQTNNIVIFYCHHLFHEECLPPLQVVVSCVICNSQKSNSIFNSAIK
ncbi:vacuolar protein sorting-associated protein 41 homolog [Macrosteles quadrilineatus]|uniref:vacuolar protein sorting-associated protein 41 homolog n=1 Tax=Macrosteles quadrilineatus TaxID=74068 RepID=UPI0023E29009|nr:vacuolar protein sorting-associated protein 41 homolog [Macrosteles quadrilineatus]